MILQEMYGGSKSKSLGYKVKKQESGENLLNENGKAWLNCLVEKITTKMDWVSEKSKNKVPSKAVNGIHDDKQIDLSRSVEDGLNWWTNGFWGGILWQMYNETRSNRYAEIARYSEKALDKCLIDYYGLHHDVGFMWMPTAVADYRLTGDQDARRRGLIAANFLAGRFNPAGKFIRAWNDMEGNDTKGWAIIDCMFNLSLLYWATEETKDPRFKQIAMMHADTTMESFIRPDGSANHIVEFDPYIGGVVRTYGGQGYENGSSWARGQSWALYGFTISYLHTGKIEYLNTAKSAAHYFIANIPESGIIPVDFRQPKEPAWEDSIAAAIAAGGLIEIAKQVGQYEKGLYLNAAVKLLKTLDEKRADWTDGCDCIIRNGSGSYHSLLHHEAFIYADYFFIEAIFKLKENSYFLW